MNQQRNSFNKTPLLLAMMIIATGQVGVSIYLPSLPMISDALSISRPDVQLIITLFLLSFGCSQLFYGPLSDAIGRRPVFLMGQGVYLLGTGLCWAFSDRFEILAAGRLLQGLGAGSASVLGRSVLRDSYDGPNLTQAMSYLAMTASVIPVISPVLGGWIAFHLGWQAVFGFVLFYLVGMVTLGWFLLPETLPYPKKRFAVQPVIADYWQLIRNPQVISSASFNWLSYLASVVSLSVLPFMMQNTLGLSSADYGMTMIIPSAGLMLGSVSLNILNRYISTTHLLLLSSALIAVAGVWMISTPMTVVHLVSAFTLITVAQGLSFPLSISMLLAPHKQHVGAVSALSGSIQMGLAGILGGAIVRYWVAGQVTLGSFYLFVSLAMALVLLFSRSDVKQFESGYSVATMRSK